MAYTALTDALLVKELAVSALTQLNLKAVFANAATGNYEKGAFEKGEAVKIRRPTKRVAQDVDPRGAGLTLAEGTFFSGELALERQWGDGFPIYGIDPSQSLDKYITETSDQMGDSITSANEPYLYGKFRNWSATTGTVRIGANSPLAIVASQSSGAYAAMNNATALNAAKVLDVNNVPDTNRYMILSPSAKTDFLGDAIQVNNFVSAMIQGQSSGTNLLANGLGLGKYVDRDGFMVTGSNVVTGQTGVADLDTASGTQATLAIASVAQDSSLFIAADFLATTYVGAVAITLTASTALSTSVAVGQIARIGVSGSITAHGVILRIDRTTATAPIVYLVPYDVTGNLITAAQITAGTDLFSVPTIRSVNVGYHKEGLLFATRELRTPSAGSGAFSGFLASPETGLSIQVLQGSYDVTKTKENSAFYTLTGATFSDYRKGVLVLSN
jgi:hypothetical protein